MLRLSGSILLWGPPVTGKTTLAQAQVIFLGRDCQQHPSNRLLVASHFETLSAVLAGKTELRVVIDKALERRTALFFSALYQKRTILFVKDVLESLN